MLKYLFGFLLSSIIICDSFCQTKPPVKNGTVTMVKKFKPPAVKTYLGNNADTVVVKEKAKQLISMPLKITDDKNNSYAISSYQFMYKKRDVFDNEQTGKREVAISNIADVFKITPLPKVWCTTVSDELQKDEELYFFDIIVLDKLNRRFYAPDLKIVVQ